MKATPKSRPLRALVVLLMLTAGCASWNQRPADRGPVASNEPVVIRHCPGRFQRARTGGFVGTVFGLLVGSLTGSPVVAGIYKVAGYAAGMAASDNCTEQGFVVERVGPVQAADPPLSPERTYEEALTVSARP